MDEVLWLKGLYEVARGKGGSKAHALKEEALKSVQETDMLLHSAKV